MHADAAPVLSVFEIKQRLEVPLFQRQYVWKQGKHWEPLWEDVERKFTDQIQGRADAPVHFLGAMVLDQKHTPTTHVTRRQVIDGQQRLTTLQIFLASLRDFCTAYECDDLARECDSFILNKGMMSDPDVDRFKVWPTQRDRGQFVDVMLSRSRAALEKKHPQTRKKWARKPDPRPRMVEAYLFFYDRLSEFFLGIDDEPPLGEGVPLADRVEEAFQALRSTLHVVVIDLDSEDDAQVIFETLNARGEPLLPADLLRNYIFLRAARRNEDLDDLYGSHWRAFDEPFWHAEVRQGRLKRPRSDLFMQHFLASRQTVDIPIRHLFAEYKFWIRRSEPFTDVREEVATLCQQGRDFRRLMAPKAGDVLLPLSTLLTRFDMSTVYPLALFLFEVGFSDDDWAAVAEVIESYVVRRSVCGMTAKNYNRVFLGLTKTMRRDGASVERLRSLLAGLSGESTEWPSDERFREAWLTAPVYERVKPAGRIAHILRRLNDTYHGPKNEAIVIEGDLTIEHLLPQRWEEHWPLPDGSTGLRLVDLWEADPTDPRVGPSRRREALLHTLGNLTILTQALNSEASNSAWAEKKAALQASSLLPINLPLYQHDAWDEERIEHRGEQLFQRAVKIWPGPPDIKAEPADPSPA